MKKLTFLLFICIGCISTLKAQQSDYQTIQTFKADIEQFNHQIENAITSKQLENVEIELEEFHRFYSDQSELIDRSIYPRSLELEIEVLKSKLFVVENHLIMIEHQRERLFEIGNRITAQRTEINRLYAITDSLKSEILDAQTSESRLSSMITSYRKQLEKRDKLIFQMIDSLVITHENIIFEHLKEGASRNYTIVDSGNPLQWIEAMIEENIKYARQQNRLLNAEDYLRMHVLQQHFEVVWEKVGDDLISVYGQSQKVEIAQSMEESIHDWKRYSSESMWASIDHYLQIKDIEITEFDTPESFYMALEAYIQNGIRNSESELLSTNGYADYIKVADFWRSTFKNDWNLKTAETRLLSSDEIELIDAALQQWEETSRPIHPMLIAILSIMMVSLTGFILVMIRAKAVR